MKIITLLFCLILQSRGSPLLNIPTIDVANPDVDTFNYAIQNIGGVAFTGLGHMYESAVAALDEEAPNCPHQEFFDMQLEGPGAHRLTIGVDSSNNTDKFPDCVKEPADIIGKAFDKLEKVVINLLSNALEDDKDKLKVNVDGLFMDLGQLPTRTHLHLYTGQQTSYPLHTDNGLFLLVTPSSSQQLQIMSKQGHLVNTDKIPSDSVLFLVGSALTNWLLPSSVPLSIYPAPHLVPHPTSLLSHKHRTVLARMKIAPLNSSPLHSNMPFHQHFMTVSDLGSLCPIPHWNSAHQAACDEDSALCWMDGCLPLPPGCSVDESVCVTDTLEPCCTPTVTDNCEDMNTSCHWTC